MAGRLTAMVDFINLDMMCIQQIIRGNNSDIVMKNELPMWSYNTFCYFFAIALFSTLMCGGRVDLKPPFIVFYINREDFTFY